MKADPFQIGDVLKASRRFVVPIYQRTYDWDIAPQLEAFFEQMAAKADERLQRRARFPHYMGALLVIPRGGFSFGRMQVYDVVDGQQRLTTFQLLLIALRDLATQRGRAETADLLSSFLVNPSGPHLHDRMESYKLYPTLADRQLFMDLVDLSGTDLKSKYPNYFYKNGKVLPDAPRLVQAWNFFLAEAEGYIQNAQASGHDGLEALSAVLLEDFHVIVITLDEQQDDAQVIFETLNAGGKALAAMDLVRNDVFHRAARAGEDVEVLMERRWKIFEEKRFWKDIGTRGRIKKPRIDFFLSDTLAAETGDEVLLTELYAHYKRFVHAQRFLSVDAELEALLKHAKTYEALVQPTGATALENLGRELTVLDITTAYPLAFVVADSGASEEEKRMIYRLIVSYVVRRLLCGLTAKNYNNIFPRISKALRERGVSAEVAQAALSGLDGDTQRFPGNSELIDAIMTRPQYGNVQQQRLRFILGELERASRTLFHEPADVPAGLTIEHILPNEWIEHWPLSDGTKAASDLFTGMTEVQMKEISERQALKSTLGNLTLVTPGLNPSIGNLSFAYKREQYRSQSLLHLNHELAELPDWNVARIRGRSARLAQHAITVWPDLKD